MLQIGTKQSRNTDKARCSFFAYRDHPQDSSLAFTLIELLLVVILLGVLIGFSIPNFSKHYASLQLQQAAGQMSYLIRYGQSAAIVDQKEYRVCFDAERLSYVLQEESESQGAQALLQDKPKEFAAVPGEKGRVFYLPEVLSWDAENMCAHCYTDGTLDRVKITLKTKGRLSAVISTQEQRGTVNVFFQDQE